MRTAIGMGGPGSPQTTDSSGNPAGNVVLGDGKANFTPSAYTGKVTSANAGTTFAIATGATKIKLQSLEVTTTAEFAVLAFGIGEDGTDAQANLDIDTNVSRAGIVIRSGVTDVVQPMELVLEIPSNATYAAIGNSSAGDNQVIMVTQGV